MADDDKKTDRASGEFVVLHDMVSYADPEHSPVPGQPRGLLYATRGQVLGSDELQAPSKQEINRLEKLGAVTSNKDAIDARLALAGQRADARLSAPGYISLASPAEQVRAQKAVGLQPGGVSPQSDKRSLARLAIGDLKVMAVAYGHAELAESDSKDEIIDTLLGGHEDASSAEEIAEQRQIRDEGQIAGRDYQQESGTLGSNVMAGGVRADTGERTKPTEGRRKSAAQKARESQPEEKAAREG